MRLRLAATLTAAVALPSLLAAQEPRPRVEIGVLGRTTFENPGLDLKEAMSGGVRFGVKPFSRFDRLRVEGDLVVGSQDNLDTKTPIGRDPIYDASRTDVVGRVLYEQPLVSRVHGLIGLGYQYSDANKPIFAGRNHFHSGQALLGLRLGLTEQVSLRMEGTYSIGAVTDTMQMQVPTPPSPQTIAQWGLQAGVSIGFGGRRKAKAEPMPMPAPAPAPVPVVEPIPEVPVLPEPEPIAESQIARVTLSTIHFAYDRATLTAVARRKIRETADTLKTHQQMIVDIVGHTDSKGTVNYNQKLSERRAIAVRDYLLDLGIGVTRMSVKGMGDREPVADNATAEGRAKNRRVEILGEKR